MIEIGQGVSEQLDIVPMQVLPKSNTSNDLLALLLIIKYVDGLPLARFEYVLARPGVLVPRRTLARRVIGTAQALQPIANLI